MNINSDYQNSIDYLYSFINFSITRNLRYSEEKFNLSRMTEIMALMGDPHLDYDVIHVAGTKGKGSTCAMIASILNEAGYKVGFYSSPHLVDFRERIKVDGVDISKKEFVQYINNMKPAVEKVENISTFEIATALAFEYFSKKAIDVAVIEVGMGGRLDATNIVEPVLSVITSISLDHTKILGDTIEKIAAEKAGIIKENIPVIMSNQLDEVIEVITNVAKMNNCRLVNVNSDYVWKQLSYSLTKQEFTISEKNQTLNKNHHCFKIPLLGDHQIDNALTAYAVIRSLPASYQILQSAIISGFRNVDWPGRFEVISATPLVIVDGAHNPDSFQKLAKTIEKYLAGKDVTIIFGASEDKDVHSMIKIIKPYIKKIIFTKSDHPRALDKDELLTLFPSEIEKINFVEIEQIPEIIKMDKQSVYVAAGSIFVASAIKELFKD